MPRSADVLLRSAADAAHLVGSICDLYDETFSAAPFAWTDEESEHHREMLVSMLTEPSFGIATAQAGGALVGFAYGYTLPPTTRWWQGFQQPVAAELTEERDNRTFALIDLAVRERWRAHGIGRRLVDVLLASRHEDRATLCVQPTATAAQAFYHRLGWRRVGRKDMPSGAVSPSFDVYVVELGDKP
jgi:ribosomal protein S18 acetylase RimI-like enzyme